MIGRLLHLTWITALLPSLSQLLTIVFWVILSPQTDPVFIGYAFSRALLVGVLADAPLGSPTCRQSCTLFLCSTPSMCAYMACYVELALICHFNPGGISCGHKTRMP